MSFGGSFGKNLDIVKRELDALVLRQNVIANNIANADTPNFKRSTVDFETELAKALASEGTTSVIPQMITDPRHIPFETPADYKSVTPRRMLDYLSTAQNNGNNVDMEQEAMDSLDTQLLYTALSTSISGAFQRVNIVLK